MKRIFSLQHYYALHSHVVNLKSKCASTIYWRTMYMTDKMCMIDHPVYFSSLSSHLKPESSSDFVDMRKCDSKSEARKAGINRENSVRTYPRSMLSNNICPKSKNLWVQEGQSLRFHRASQQIDRDLVNNCVKGQRSMFLGAGKGVSQNLNSNGTAGVLQEGETVDDGSIYENITLSDASCLDNHMLEVSNSLATSNDNPNFDPRQVAPIQALSKSFQSAGSPSQKFHTEEHDIIYGQKDASMRILMDDDCAEHSNTSSTMERNIYGRLQFDREVHLKRITQVYNKILIVDNVSTAKRVVRKLRMKYKNLIHACDTEVAGIDVKLDPIGHGEIICFSIYSGPQADFGNGKSCIWVDLLDGERNILMEFAPFFEDSTIKKVWHNHSFDYHALENHGIRVSGFHADTMHLARLWDSSRRNDGGYSLEALTGDSRVMSGESSDTQDRSAIGKISMKQVFGRSNTKKDGSEGKLITVPPIEVLQKEERIPWICYSALDSVSTLKLFKSLKYKLSKKDWFINSEKKGSMYDFYESYWRPFGNQLVKLESEGMRVDRAYLAEIEKVATVEKQAAADRFCKWAAKYCPDARYMNVGSDAQIRQLFFGGVQNRRDNNESLPMTKAFKVPNIDKVIEIGKTSPSKYLNINLTNICKEQMEAHSFTVTGWPSVTGDALKTFAGKVSADELCINGDSQFESDDHDQISTVGSNTVHDVDSSPYGKAYAAFGEGQEGIEACYAIAALYEVSSIDSLLSNFILPLQENHISGKDGRVHCSLNINTETGRLSARRPNLQNQPAFEKDRYKIRQAFVAEPGNSLIVADYGQLELRLLAHLADCKSMLNAFKAGGDFHSRTAMNMYDYIQEAVSQKSVLLEWHPRPGQEEPPVPLLKDVSAVERRKAKMLNFSIAYGKTPIGLSMDWKVSIAVAKETVDLWYKERQEVLAWQKERKKEALEKRCVHTLLGRARMFPSVHNVSSSQRGHIERAAINAPVQGSAADVTMCAMLEIEKNSRLMELKWKLLLQVHDEVILEGPTESAEEAKAIVVDCMLKPFDGQNILKVDLAVDAKCAQNWYAAN